jgi:hypothetical protein
MGDQKRIMRLLSQASQALERDIQSPSNPKSHVGSLASVQRFSGHGNATKLRVEFLSLAFYLINILLGQPFQLPEGSFPFDNLHP